MKAFSAKAMVCLTFLIPCAQTQATELTGRAVSVHDGDTITVLDADKRQHKVRLAGVDAPELKQAFGTRSRQNLAGLVRGQDVRVEWEKTDRNGRTVGKVLFMPSSCLTPACLEPADANYEQIATGMAWYYRQYARELKPEDCTKYDAAENRARGEKLGLSADVKPVAPGEWRRVGKSSVANPR